MKKIGLLVAICIAMSATFCGCNQSSDTNSGIMGISVTDIENLESAIIGEWVLSAVEYSDGKIISFEEYCASQNLDISQTQTTYNFDKDGAISREIGTTEVEGTYEINGASVKCIFSNDEITMLYDENNGFFTTENSDMGVKNIFIKQ